MSLYLSFALSLLAAAVGVNAATYTLSKFTQGNDFYGDYSFQAIPDPTNGRVNYVSQSTAQSLGLSYVEGTSFYMRADDTTTLSSSGPGRNSIRIQSNDAYGTHVTVFNIEHMPQGDGTWPAAWEVGPDWPNGGEVDIIEGINDVAPNLSSLHVASTCTMPSVDEIGSVVSTDCDVNDNSNQGCGVHVTQANSYGPDFNNNGGGWYAMERTNSEVKVWFWERNDSDLPTGMANGDSSIDTDNWGTPFAYFVNTDCDIAELFSDSNIIFDLTFCGDWAGNDFNGGIDACNAYVDNNPSAFSGAYWQVGFVSVYE